MHALRAPHLHFIILDGGTNSVIQRRKYSSVEDTGFFGHPDPDPELRANKNKNYRNDSEFFSILDQIQAGSGSGQI